MSIVYICEEIQWLGELMWLHRKSVSSTMVLALPRSSYTTLKKSLSWLGSPSPLFLGKGVLVSMVLTASVTVCPWRLLGPDDLVMAIPASHPLEMLVFSWLFLFSLKCTLSRQGSSCHLGNFLKNSCPANWLCRYEMQPEPSQVGTLQPLLSAEEEKEAR